MTKPINPIEFFKRMKASAFDPVIFHEAGDALDTAYTLLFEFYEDRDCEYLGETLDNLAHVKQRLYEQQQVAVAHDIAARVQRVEGFTTTDQMAALRMALAIISGNLR